MPDPDWEPEPTPEPGKWTAKKVKQEIDRLRDHEGGDHNGHTIKKHVRKNTESLYDRVNNDKKTDTATSFKNYKTANRVVRETVKENAQDIADFLNDDNRDIGEVKTLERKCKNSIGYGVQKNQGFKNDLKEAIVKVQKTNDGYKIITSFPKY
jgi:uncharacterized membrane-anchored protein YjiN (DUF445 family)